MDQILHTATIVPNMHLIPLEKYDPVHQYEKMLDKMKQRKDFDVKGAVILNPVTLYYKTISFCHTMQFHQLGVRLVFKLLPF